MIPALEASRRRKTREAFPRDYYTSAVLTRQLYKELSGSSASEWVNSPSDCVETVWTNGRDGENREGINVKSKDSKATGLRGELLQHTDGAARVYHLGDREPDN